MEGFVDPNKLLSQLIDEKLINKRQAKDALTEHEKSNRPIGDVLLDMKLVTPGVLSELQAKTLGMEHIKINDLRLDSNITKLLPKRYVVEHRAIPLSLSGNILTVAMEKPQDVLAVDEIELLTGYKVKAVVCSPKDIQFGLEQYPDEEGGVSPVIVGTQVSQTMQTVQFLVFMVLLMVPIVLTPVIASMRNEWVLYLSSFDNLIVLLLAWLFYAIVLFYIYSVISGPPAPKQSKTDNE